MMHVPGKRLQTPHLQTANRAFLFVHDSGDIFVWQSGDIFQDQNLLLIEYGVEGRHFTRAADNSPVKTELGKKELSGAYPNLGGHPPAIFGNADAPDYVRQTITYQNENLKYLEKDLFKGIKLELPAAYAAAYKPSEDKIKDILAGRRPISEIDSIVKEYMAAGGEEGRTFMEKTLADNGR